MRTLPLFIILAITGLAAPALEFTFEEKPGELVLLGDGKPWLSTQTPAFDRASREETYKVFTHVYDFEGEAPITKGAGGKYTHHRGMFIGWRDTVVGGAHYDTWHMKDNYQKHVKWASTKAKDGKAIQVEEVHWCTLKGDPFIKETRTITAGPGPDGTRLFTFESVLESLEGSIQLRGDLQHAGMQVRMANEVSEHEDSTRYIFPAGAEELDDDKVPAAWWMCCSPVVRGERYWVMHMTDKDIPGNKAPVYSIRRYARFGAFFEPDIEKDTPLTMRFRVLLSGKELDQARCEELYKQTAN